MTVSKALLMELEDAACDLRCVGVPTGSGDYEIEWQVIEHHLVAPKERVVGRGIDVIVALKDAFDEQKKAGTT